MPNNPLEGLERALFEEAGDALFLFEPESDKLLAVNAAAERLTSLPRADMLKKPATYWFRFGNQDAKSKDPKGKETKTKGGKDRLREAASKSDVFGPQEGYLLRTGAEGVWVPVTVVISRLHVRPQTLALITARDVRGQREAEERLKKLNTFLDSIVANVPLMLFVKDAESLRFELHNKAGEDLLGYRKEDLLGKNDYDFFPKEEADFFIQKDREVLQGKKMVDIPEEEIQTKNGIRTLHTRKIPILDEKGTPRYLLGISEDITERKRLREFLARNEKLTSIGRLSAGVAHEINNPLSVVANNLTVLQRDCLGLLQLIEVYEAERAIFERAASASARKVAEVAEEIDLEYIRENLQPLLARTKEGLDRVTRIVNSLRGHARIEPVQKKDIYIPDLLETCLEIVQVRLRDRKIQVERDYQNPPRVRCIFSDIHQVLVNLLLNACQAIEAMPPERPGLIHIRVRADRDDLLTEVRDNGCGIPPDDLPCLFDPFFTTRDVREGSGLGLWISHSIVAAHGGRLEVESQLGVGTCFRVVLPIHGGQEM